MKRALPISRESNEPSRYNRHHREVSDPDHGHWLALDGRGVTTTRVPETARR